MKTKHTSGPWRAYKVNPGKEFKVHSVHHQPRGAEYLAKCSAAAGLPADADARLIASAPELLEALKAAEMELQEYAATLRRDHPMHDMYLVLDRVQAAIAKAEGDL